MLMRVVFFAVMVVLPSTIQTKSQTRVLPNIPIVTLCELVCNSARYHNKLVRLRSSYLAGYHEDFLYDLECDQRDFWVETGIRYRGERLSTCRQPVERLNTLLRENLSRHPSGVGGRAEVVLVGRFRDVYPRTRAHRARTIVRSGTNHIPRFDFEIVCPEEARPIPDNVPWPTGRS